MVKTKSAVDSEIYKRASESIAHAALTNSKRAESFVKGVYPTHLKKGQGCYVWDTHGNKYIDFIAGLGSNLLGYAQEEITQAIAKRASLGASLSLGTDLEVETAEKVKELFPFIEKVRFLKTGSDACSASIRIARAFTGRPLIFSDGYHGWHDEFVSLTPPASGVHFCSDIRSTKQWDDFCDKQHTAAIIVEPIITDVSSKRITWLEGLRKECTHRGMLLIFDEVITGLRYPQHSVSRAYDVIPDIICLGKAIANGMPLSIVGGKADIMDSDYFVSSTFAGETLSLAAALKTMELMQTKFDIGYLWEKGHVFMSKFNDIWSEGITLEGYPTRSILKGDELTKALFMQECCKAGILIGPSVFFTFPHIDVTDQALSIFSDILRRIKLGNVKLEGEMPQKPYAQKAREK